MSQDANVLVMDEPTSALIIEETNRLFAIIRNLTAHGVAVIYISHRLEEIFRIADRVTVRRATLRGPWPGSSIDAGESPGHPAEDRF